MSVFRITGSSKKGSEFSVFTVEAIAGDISVGEEFRCYDTHHPCDFTIVEVKKEKKKAVLTCRGWLGFDEQFQGMTIDTAHKITRPGSRYEPNKKEA